METGAFVSYSFRRACEYLGLLTRKANTVMKIRNSGPNWAVHMVKRLVGSQKFITDGSLAEGPATALGRRPKNGGELHT